MAFQTHLADTNFRLPLILKNKKIDERFVMIGEGLIEIRNVKFEDQGQILCNAKSVLGEEEKIATCFLN